MKPGEVAQWEHKRIRCVDGRQLTQATRCQRCYFRYHALCGWLHCIGVYYIHPKEKKRKSAKKTINNTKSKHYGTTGHQTNSRNRIGT